ncbi:MAG: DUF1460 domain-containing protein [Prevotellaceae bacterium]|nr:DUF1460 domain-containing protein [Prevotellaceae bacterium]MDY6130297.1 DUF1460 domain-containing protein [Prevotella sp.]
MMNDGLKKRLLLFCALLASCAAAAQPQYAKADSLKVADLLWQARKSPSAHTNYMLYFGRKLQGIPYVAHTLESNNRERLVVNLRQLDCTTFTENVLALTLCMQNKAYTFKSFCDYLQKIRYRGGGTPAYTSRLHYFTTWILDNTQMGICREIQSSNPPFTAVQTVQASFMSTHPDKYRMLKATPQDIPAIRAMEKEIEGKKYRYIPKEQIKNTKLLRQTIHDGDIIVIITRLKGLDTQHIGIAAWHKDGLHLLNASSIHGKVIEEPKTLRQYLYEHKSMPGIRVVRVAGM